MKVIRARVYGYCMGVRRAIKLAEQALEASGEASTKAVYAFGPLIHNPQVMADLAAQGLNLEKEENLENIPKGASLLIRAHGIGADLEIRLKELGFNIVDATCPKVRYSQRLVGKAFKAGRRVFLAGDMGHGEIKGLLGYAPTARVFPTAGDVKSFIAGLDRSGIFTEESPLLVPQTTFSQQELNAIEIELRSLFPNLESAASICPATSERQEAIAELLGKVEAVVVVGGKDSANTRRLYERALEGGKPAVHIEKPEEIPDWIFKYSSVGLSAGASTPDYLIDAVEKALLAGPAE